MNENKDSHRKITMTHTQTTYPNRIALRAGKKGARPAEVGALVQKIIYRAQSKIIKMLENNTNSDFQH